MVALYTKEGHHLVFLVLLVLPQVQVLQGPR